MCRTGVSGSPTAPRRGLWRCFVTATWFLFTNTYLCLGTLESSCRVLRGQYEFFLSKMLQKGALESVDQPGAGFCSHLFLVQKVTGGCRPLIDLSTLNGYVTLTKFRMETVVSVLGSIRKGDWMSSVAYLQILIHPESQMFSSFKLFVLAC